jgi:hypothetical protein
MSDCRGSLVPAAACLLACALLLAPCAIAEQAPEGPQGWDDIEFPELTPPAEAAIDRGLAYLVKVQKEDGSWHDMYPVGNTAGVLMAFMVKGHFPGEGPYAPTLNKGLDYLLKQSKTAPDGYVGDAMYEHGLATLAFSELWGMCKEKDDEVKKALHLAVRVLQRSQSMLGGWRYNPDGTDADTSSTSMQVVALASAREAGAPVRKETMEKATQFYELCWESDSGGFRYAPWRIGPNFPRTAASTYALMLCGQRNSEMVKGGLRYLLNLPQGAFQGNEYYFYAHYYAIQVMVQAGQTQYKKWYPRIRDALILKQHVEGSWTGDSGCKPLGTAMAIIVLGAPYRFIPIYQR